MIETCFLPVFSMIPSLRCKMRRGSCYSLFPKGNAVFSHNALNIFLSEVIKVAILGRKGEKKIFRSLLTEETALLIKNNHYLSSLESLTFEWLGPAFRSLQSQQVQVQIWKPAAWRSVSLSMLLMCISFPNISSSILHACWTPVLTQQFLLCYLKSAKEKHLEERSKHEWCLSVALWGKGMIQKWASCSWRWRAGSDLLWSMGKSVPNAASRVKGRCSKEELDWKVRGLPGCFCQGRGDGSSCAGVSPRLSPSACLVVITSPRWWWLFVWKASGRDKLDVLGSLTSWENWNT